MFSTEIGTLNTFVHLYEYDNYEHRHTCRSLSSKNEEWQNGYLKRSKQCMVRQRSSVYQPAWGVLGAGWKGLKAVSEEVAQKGDGTPGVYEFRRYNLTAVGVKQMLAGLEECMEGQISVGKVLVFVGVCDVSEQPASVLIVWRYASCQERAEIRDKGSQLEAWNRNAQEMSKGMLSAPSVILAVPMEGSPLK